MYQSTKNVACTHTHAAFYRARLGQPDIIFNMTLRAVATLHQVPEPGKKKLGPGK